VEYERCGLLRYMIRAFVSLVMQARCTKTTEQIVVLFRLKALQDMRNIVLDGKLGSRLCLWVGSVLEARLG